MSRAFWRRRAPAAQECNLRRSQTALRWAPSAAKQSPEEYRNNKKAAAPCKSAQRYRVQWPMVAQGRLVENMAERVGFEPTLPFRVNTLSKRAPSATRPSLPRTVRGAYSARTSAHYAWDGQASGPRLISDSMGE